MDMINDFNRGVCIEKEGVETAKSIIECTNGILLELENELNAIDAAIFSPKVNNGNMTGEPKNECLLAIIGSQREQAEKLLRTARHIRDGLW